MARHAPPGIEARQDSPWDAADPAARLDRCRPARVAVGYSLAPAGRRWSARWMSPSAGGLPDAAIRAA